MPSSRQAAESLFPGRIILDYPGRTGSAPRRHSKNHVAPPMAGGGGGWVTQSYVTQKVHQALRAGQRERMSLQTAWKPLEAGQYIDKHARLHIFFFSALEFTLNPDTALMIRCFYRS